MDYIRETLIAKIDRFVTENLQNASSCTGARVQIEAVIVRDDSGEETYSQPQRCVLETITLDDLKHSHFRSAESTAAGEANNQVSKPQKSTPELRLPDKGSGDEVENEAAQQISRRKMVGGLRLGQTGSPSNLTPPRTPIPPSTRQVESDERNFPKRRKTDRGGPAKLQQSTVERLIDGIWEQIHRPWTLTLGPELSEAFEAMMEGLSDGSNGVSTLSNFGNVSRYCRQITCGSRTVRALEVIIQAHWVDCFDARVAALADERPDLRLAEYKKMVLTEACIVFSWSEKELRNRMAVWRGYREIKDAAGWSALVFAGHGIYRFCKYRLDFDHEALGKLRSIRARAEVAADTLQPQWRQLLSIVGALTEVHWHGHPHDWVVSKRKDPIPLATTYGQWDPNFSFKHLEESIIDEEKWGYLDPRRLSDCPPYFCTLCSKTQSITAESNECECFPTLFSPNPRMPFPVQVFQTENGRNNGLVACCSFERGTPIGEFVGLITKDLTDVDVMQGQAGSNKPYQIWQGRYGNFTRFINHSCQPNCQFQSFTWLGVQRIIVVSKGVAAGKELTVDYSRRYWQHLDKICLCGEARCRYKDRIQ